MVDALGIADTEVTTLMPSGYPALVPTSNCSSREGEHSTGAPGGWRGVRGRSEGLWGFVRQLRFTGIFPGLLEEDVVHGSTVFSVTLFPVIMFIYTGRAYREALGMTAKFGARLGQYRSLHPGSFRDGAVGTGSSSGPGRVRTTASSHDSSEETHVKSRLSIAWPGVALALVAIAAAHAAAPSPRSAPAKASQSAPMAAKHLAAMEARMKLMQEQMRRIRATKSPEARARLLREHMHTMMEQMRAMRAMGGRMMSGMMPRGMMGSPSMGHGMMANGMMGGGNRNAPSAEQCQRMHDWMRDQMQNRLDMMQLMMEQMMGQMKAMQGMTMGGKGSR